MHLKITGEDLDKSNVYIGETPLSNFKGDVTIAIDSLVRFDTRIKISGTLKASGYGIITLGSVIAHEMDIEGFIIAGNNIEAHDPIRAGGSLSAGGYILSCVSISCEEDMDAPAVIAPEVYCGLDINADTVTADKIDAQNMQKGV